MTSTHLFLHCFYLLATGVARASRAASVCFLKEGINLSERIQLWHGDALELLKTIPDKSVDLVLTDPPYNVGVRSFKDGKEFANQWDRIQNYAEWSLVWLLESQRVLKDTGVLYFWHNDIVQLAELLEMIRMKTEFKFRSFCIWNKGEGYRARGWKFKRVTESNLMLTQWFNICEYCVHFFKKFSTATSVDTAWEKMATDIGAYEPLILWYEGELRRLNLNESEITKKYVEFTGKKPFMMGHYFKRHQFLFPVERVFQNVFAPFGFNRSYSDLRAEYERLQDELNTHRGEFNKTRPYHHVDLKHCNVWNVPPIPSTKRYHTCQKPVSLLGRLCRVSCPPDGLVLDPFMGSASTAIACIKTGRRFIGIEKDATYFDIAKKRVDLEESALNLFTQEEIEETA